MELINKIIITFLFSSIFGSLEVLIFVILDLKIQKDVKKYTLFILSTSFIHTILYNTLDKLTFNILFYIALTIVLYIVFDKRFTIALISIGKFMIYTLIIEAPISVFLLIIFNISLSKLDNNLFTLLSVLPIKVIELVIIIYIKNKGGLRICLSGGLKNLQKTLKRNPK